jgi:hypothetical protein
VSPWAQTDRAAPLGVPGRRLRATDAVGRSRPPRHRPLGFASLTPDRKGAAMSMPPAGFRLFAPRAEDIGTRLHVMVPVGWDPLAGVDRLDTSTWVRTTLPVPDGIELEVRRTDCGLEGCCCDVEFRRVPRHRETA